MHRRQLFDPAAVLRQCGLKATPGRVSVLAALALARAPLSVSQLRRGLGSKAPNLATLYRMLPELARKKLVRQIDLRDVEAYYELMDPYDHHHVVCTKCSRVEDVVLGEADKLTRRVLKRTKQFRVVTGHSLEFFGVCKRCT